MTDREKGFYHIWWKRGDRPDIAEYDGRHWMFMGTDAVEGPVEMKQMVDIGPKIEVPPVEDDMTGKFECHYSGNNSRAFWKAINDIDNERMQDILYSKGVELQNLEEGIINDLNRVIRTKGERNR